MGWQDDVTESVEAKLQMSTSESKLWMKFVGGLRHLKKENARIDRIIEQEFEQIESEDGAGSSKEFVETSARRSGTCATRDCKYLICCVGQVPTVPDLPRTVFTSRCQQALAHQTRQARHATHCRR